MGVTLFVRFSLIAFREQEMSLLALSGNVGRLVFFHWLGFRKQDEILHFKMVKFSKVESSKGLPLLTKCNPPPTKNFLIYLAEI